MSEEYRGKGKRTGATSNNIARVESLRLVVCTAVDGFDADCLRMPIVINRYPASEEGHRARGDNKYPSLQKDHGTAYT